jgi:hypothetical protein
MTQSISSAPEVRAAAALPLTSGPASSLPDPRKAAATAAQTLSGTQPQVPPPLTPLDDLTGGDLSALVGLGALGLPALAIIADTAKIMSVDRAKILNSINENRNNLGLTFVHNFQKFSSNQLQNHLDFILSTDFTRNFNFFNASNKLLESVQGLHSEGKTAIAKALLQELPNTHDDYPVAYRMLYPLDTDSPSPSSIIKYWDDSCSTDPHKLVDVWALRNEGYYTVAKALLAELPNTLPGYGHTYRMLYPLDTNATSTSSIIKYWTDSHSNIFNKFDDVRALHSAGNNTVAKALLAELPNTLPAYGHTYRMLYPLDTNATSTNGGLLSAFCRLLHCLTRPFNAQNHLQKTLSEIFFQTFR